MSRIYDELNLRARDLWRVVPRENVINELLRVYRPHAEAVAARFSREYPWLSFDEFLATAIEKQWNLALKYDADSGASFTTLCHSSLQFAWLRSNLPMNEKLKRQIGRGRPCPTLVTQTRNNGSQFPTEMSCS